MKRFRSLTTNSTIIMGRKTWESIGKPLPNRQNCIITSALKDCPEGTETYLSISSAISAAQYDNVCLIGGFQIYKEGMSSGIVDEIDHTVVNIESKIDDTDENMINKSVWFPRIPLTYRFISEIQNETDPLLFHRTYKIDPIWKLA